MKTFLGAPIRHLGEPVGNIYLTEKEGGREFTPEDEDILVLFAAQAAMAIANASELQGGTARQSRPGGPDQHLARRRSGLRREDR